MVPTIFNLFKDIDLQASGETFTTLLETKTLKLEQIVSRTDQSHEKGWYDQDQDEWVMLLQGSARLELGKRIVDLEAGDSLLIKSGVRHRLLSVDRECETVWLALFIKVT